MSEALRLRLPSDEPFDRLWYLPRLRDAGLIGSLGPGELRVLLLAVALADAHGQVDVPQHWFAEELGLTARTVRDAVRELRSADLLDDLPRRGRAKRYQVLMPPHHTPRRWASQAAAERPDRAGDQKSVSGSPPTEPEISFRQPGNEFPPTRKPVSPKAGSKAGAESKPQQGGRSAPSESAERPLFDPPAYDGAAAAALQRVGFPERVAHGLVSCYRPTVADVRRVIANAFAWRWAAARGEADRLRDLKAFIRSEIRRGNWSTDERVHNIAARGRKRRAARRRARATQSRPDPLARVRQEYRAVRPNAGEAAAQRAAAAVAKRLGLNPQEAEQAIQQAATIIQESEAING